MVKEDFTRRVRKGSTLQPIEIKSATPGIDGTRAIDGLSENERAEIAFLWGTVGGFVVGFGMALLMFIGVVF